MSEVFPCFITPDNFNKTISYYYTVDYPSLGLSTMYPTTDINAIQECCIENDNNPSTIKDPPVGPLIVKEGWNEYCRKLEVVCPERAQQLPFCSDSRRATNIKGGVVGEP